MVTLCELIKYTQLGTTSAENLIKLHFIRIRRCDEMYLPLSLKFCAARVFWEVQKQILSLCSYKKVWKPTASTLSLRRTTKQKTTAKPWRRT